MTHRRFRPFRASENCCAPNPRAALRFALGYHPAPRWGIRQSASFNKPAIRPPRWGIRSSGKRHPEQNAGTVPAFPPVFCLCTIGGSAPGASCLVLGLGDLSVFAVKSDSQRFSRRYCRTTRPDRLYPITRYSVLAETTGNRSISHLLTTKKLGDCPRVF